MLIPLELILLNFYYIGVAIALLIRDILYLRIILIFSGAALISYGIYTYNSTVIFWNILFLSINAVQIIIILYQRKPVMLDPELIPLYDKIFYSMSKKDFLNLWKLGDIFEENAVTLCTKGKRQKFIFMIIDGEAEVIKKTKVIATLTTGNFIAELSFFTGKAASADVIAKGNIKYIGWTHDDLHKIRHKNSELYNIIHHILTADISEKLYRSDD
jgi:hypothetical protein